MLRLPEEDPRTPYHRPQTSLKWMMNHSGPPNLAKGVAAVKRPVTNPNTMVMRQCVGSRGDGSKNKLAHLEKRCLKLFTLVIVQTRRSYPV